MIIVTTETEREMSIMSNQELLSITEAITYEEASHGVTRQYFGFGASELDRRNVEALSEAWATIGRFAAGDAPAQIVVTPEALGKIQEVADEAEGILPSTLYQREGEQILRNCVLPPSQRRPDFAGIGSVTLDYCGEAPTPFAAWNGDEADPQFFPVVAFSLATPEGLLNSPWADGFSVPHRGGIAAFAHFYVPQALTKRAARRVNGKIVPASLEPTLWAANVAPEGAPAEWVPGADMIGIVRVYTDLATAEAERDELRRAVRLIQRTYTALEEEVTPEVNEGKPRVLRRA